MGKAAAKAKTKAKAKASSLSSAAASSSQPFAVAWLERPTEADAMSGDASCSSSSSSSNTSPAAQVSDVSLLHCFALVIWRDCLLQCLVTREVCLVHVRRNNIWHSQMECILQCCDHPALCFAFLHIQLGFAWHFWLAMKALHVPRPEHKPGKLLQDKGQL